MWLMNNNEGMKSDISDNDECDNLLFVFSQLYRHKIITTVTVIQNKNQGVQVSSRALWNQKFDNYASLVYDGPNYYAVGSVYAVYYD